MAGGPPPQPTEPSLETLRQKIDALDRQIVDLLNARSQIVVQVGHIQQQSKAPIYAPDREKWEVLEKVTVLEQGAAAQLGASRQFIAELMSGSFALEKPLRIGFLGPAGTFSHGAAVRKFGSSVEYTPLADIPSVFEEVVRGHVDYGLVPVENSLHGGVVDTLDAFLTSSAKICAEVRITIHHCLLAREPWDSVRTIHSKPEIFSQCRKWLSAMAKDRDIQPSASSSKAAETAAHEAGAAAIGTKQAGELYGLHVLFENIEDDPENETRFLVIGRAEPARHSGDDKIYGDHVRPRAQARGALAEVLDVWARRTGST